MPLDTSIPLQAKAPESNPLATLLQVSQYKYLNQNTDKVRQDMDAQNALGQLIQKNTGQDGKVNLQGVMADAANTPAAAYGMKDYVGTNLTNQGQQITNQGGQIKNASDQFALHKSYTDTALQTASGLLQDPRISAPDGQYDPEKASAALSEGFQQMVAKGVPVNQALVATAPFVNAIHQPGAVATMLQNTIRGNLGAQGQAAVAAPSGVSVSDGQTSKVVNTNGLSSLPVGAAIPGTTQQQKLAPGQQQSIGSDSLGNQFVVKRDAVGNIVGTGGVPGGYNASAGQAPATGPVTLPPGGAEDIKAVSGEVAAARAAANQAPMMHDLNRSIVTEVDKGLNTGSLGKLTQKVASATGYNLGSESATDYNVLGKMLERSAISAAQSMGPQTNAGLEAQIRANGSLDYTPQAIRKIAMMNDAITTGAEKYRTGLEAAIQAAGGSQLAKRQFDQAWAKNFDVRIARLENASQAGDKKEIDAILKEVGGKGSKGAAELTDKIQKLNLLTSQGHL